MKILGANLYVKNKRPDDAAAVIRRARPRVAVLSELHGNRGFEVPGYEKYDNGPACSVGFLFRPSRWLRVERVWFVRGSEPITEDGPNSHARDIGAMDLRGIRRRYRIIAVHAPFAGENPRNIVEAGLSAYWGAVEELAREGEDEGRIVGIVGDFNNRPRRGQEPAAYHPTAVAGDLGYRYLNIGLDGLMAKAPRVLGVIEPQETGSNHQWLLGAI